MTQQTLENTADECYWLSDKEFQKSYFYETYCVHCDGRGNITFPENQRFIKKGTCGRYTFKPKEEQ